VPGAQTHSAAVDSRAPALGVAADQWRKSNEIVADLKLLGMLMIKGAIVRIDAIGCQREIAERILDNKTDYILALKGN
jgi:predicted transposase YbfD/YdcC